MVASIFELILVFIVLFGGCMGSMFHTIEQPFRLNPMNLTVMSFKFIGEEKKRSDWFGTTFGPQSLWFNESVGKYLNSSLLSPYEQYMSNVTARRLFYSPLIYTEPDCSIELLGYAYLDVDRPFLRRSKTEAPSYGNATLSWYLDGSNLFKWPCVYRAMYENWRPESHSFKPHFWATFFYCPAPYGKKSCGDIRRESHSRGVPNRPIHFNLSTELATMTWQSNFTARLHAEAVSSLGPDQSLLSSSSLSSLPSSSNDSVATPLEGRKGDHRGRPRSEAQIVVCGVIPYTTHEPAKARANGAMILEWIHYYSTLGMKVIIYDRDGANQNFIQNKTHHSLLGGADVDFIYHNYTVRGMLDPAHAGLHYDNYEAGKKMDSDLKMRYETQGHDKVNTLTHCRFEAEAIFGTKYVLVADFDEFLYCPAAPNTALEQFKYIYSLVNDMHRLGKQQLMFRQRVLFNKTASPKDCIVDMADSGASVFHCFAANEYYLRGHSIKSLHIGHTCPITGYHQACPHPDTPRAYNCKCENEMVKEVKCTLIHLSTQPQLYDKRYGGQNLTKLIHTDIELLSIAGYTKQQDKGQSFKKTITKYYTEMFKAEKIREEQEERDKKKQNAPAPTPTSGTKSASEPSTTQGTTALGVSGLSPSSLSSSSGDRFMERVSAMMTGGLLATGALLLLTLGILLGFYLGVLYASHVTAAQVKILFEQSQPGGRGDRRESQGGRRRPQGDDQFSEVDVEGDASLTSSPTGSATIGEVRGEQLAGGVRERGRRGISGGRPVTTPREQSPPSDEEEDTEGYRYWKGGKH